MNTLKMRAVQFDGNKETRMTFGNIDDSNELLGGSVSTQSAKGKSSFK